MNQPELMGHIQGFTDSKEDGRQLLFVRPLAKVFEIADRARHRVPREAWIVIQNRHDVRVG
ncbi:hypothetical protein ATE80_25670 [Streptomyces kanasensis]|uniref:Uncharacterized protein n=1 Tax=Streptomyces kanasensis TaxID=936756 RepID=A0A100Y1Q9_9ACTN|nr:hypothetical protein ATE80_25670 [Streptomyces kanasensis]